MTNSETRGEERWEEEKRREIGEGQRKDKQTGEMMAETGKMKNV